ncbi:LigA [Anaeromyxobacter sp. K]|nr:LigA [Anaeromyxobacter sp. K]
MPVTDSPTRPTPRPAGAAEAPAVMEARLTALLVTGALLAGALLQVWVPPGALTLVVASGIAGAVVLAVALLTPGRLRATIAGFRFTSTLLVALAVFAIVGTLVLQGKPAEFYRLRYGAAAPLILGLHLDDVFHGLPFAGLMALFGAAVIASAAQRWPLRARNAGFFLCHLGLVTSLGGAAASAALSIRGRIDLHAGGETATHVRVTKAGMDTGGAAPLGFDLRLDRFDLVNYETEYRVGYYRQELVRDEHGTHRQWKLAASFDPDLERHLLPGGDTFRLKEIWPDFTPQDQVAPVAAGGQPALQATLEGQTRWLLPGERLATPDGRAAVVFGWERPAAPPGALTAFLVSGAERKVVVHTADGESEVPLAEGLALAGGAVRLGALVPQAQRTQVPATASAEWKRPVVRLEAVRDGTAAEKVMAADRPEALFLDADHALVFERRDGEVKAFLSTVTATRGDESLRTVVAVNEPVTFAGWTLYQVNYNPQDPSYSGLEAVHDPGVAWVFAGFALISLGVAYMFYVEPRLKARRRAQPGVPTSPAQAA